MSNYIVSARKYRPKRFDEVVGQQHITKTLKNAIKKDKIAQAFLFCGPRGIGKTTCARILAKTINCENLGSDVEACGECNSCQSFQSQSSFNIHELDAASNNSVEDMRSLTEQVRYPPQTGQYKIYIIDEVHMLSQSAFNAFLKTLEEPPPYAIFILATTEKHRILPTILSRCQIFDFNRIEVNQIVKHLQQICEKENIEYEDDVLHLTAQKADGALRDALSIFDRLVSFADGRLTYEQVLDNLNILDYDYYFKIVDALLSEDRTSVLNLYNEVLQKGFEGETFIHGLSQHLRDLMMCKDPSTVALLEVSENLKDRYREQAAYSPSGLLLSALDIANESGIQYKYSKNKRLTIELALMKMCYVEKVVADPTVEIEDEVTGKKKASAPSDQVADPRKPAPAKENPPASASEQPVTQAKSPTGKEQVSEEPAHYDEKPEAPKNEPIQPAEEKEAPVPPRKAKKRKQLLGRFNASHDDLLSEIDEAQQKQQEAEEPESAEVVQRMPAIEEHVFKDAWQKMVKKVRELDNTTLHTILQSYDPQFLSGYQIKVTVSNKVELELMKNEKVKITDMLSDILNQSNLELLIDHDPDIRPNEDEENGKKHYTVEEKLEILKAANPRFEELRKKLGLEPDF